MTEQTETRSIAVVTITNPDTLFDEGEILEGFAPDSLDGDDYETPRARALYEAKGVSPEDEEEILGLLPDGRWALLGLTVAGHAFAVERKEEMTVKDRQIQTICDTEAQAKRAMASLNARYGERYDFSIERSDETDGWIVYRAEKEKD